MRSFDGQRSDNRPVKRTDAEKRRALIELEANLAALGPKPASGLKASIEQRIKDLKEELSRGSR